MQDTKDGRYAAAGESGSTAVRGGMRVRGYAPDAISNAGTAVRVICAVLGGMAATLAAWFVLKSISLAAFNASMVTRALATACAVALLALLTLLLWAWIRDRDHATDGELASPRPRWRAWLTEAVCALAPAGVVVASLGIPLSATRLYLDGIQVDQGFRTQFLTRMTESLGNQDMSYVDLPTFYPLGWFWLGGRMAGLLNMPGWEVYQPWALVSLAGAACALTPIWRKLTGSLPVATAIAVVTTAIILTDVPDEPYAAVVAMFSPAAAVMGYRAIRGSWASTLALTVYLGVSACFYTLYTGIMALTMVVFAVVAVLRGPSADGEAETSRWVPVRQLAVMGFGSIAIALIAWAPYLIEAVTGDYVMNSTAPHFLPSEGTVIPLPFFELSLVGVLSLIGVIFIIMRFDSPEIRHLGIAVVVSYAWVLLSMVATLAGTTLLGFRVEVLIALMLATAGILALADLRLVGVDYLYPDKLGTKAQRAITAGFVVLIGAATVAYVQQIPDENEKFIDEAYASTDGYGERGDLRESDAGRYYTQIDEFIREHRGEDRTDTVIFTDEINFMSYHPYYGFNAFTSHYANPLGEFDLRNEKLAEWGRGSFEELSDPQAFLDSLDEAPWRAPEAFIFRGTEVEAEEDGTEDTTDGEANSTDVTDDPWKTHLAHDIFPNQPNIRYEALFFNPEAFDSPEWQKAQFGPFVVVVRN